MCIKVSYFSFAQDYYGVPFPGTTATLPGRDGLGNNPYSSKLHLLANCFDRFRFGLMKNNIFSLQTDCYTLPADVGLFVI